METLCIVIVGKPGAGKSSIGSELAKHIGGTYISLGGFMRGVLHIPDPHIGVDKNIVYNRLSQQLENGEMPGTLILDCHPYPESDLEALLSFIRKPSLTLRAVIHVDADDEVVLERLRRRPRSGQTNEERIKYFNDNRHIIDVLLRNPLALRIENNTDSSDEGTFDKIAEMISRRL